METRDHIMADASWVEAHTAGFLAWKNGKRYGSNPYLPHTHGWGNPRLREAWDVGYEYAQAGGF